MGAEPVRVRSQLNAMFRALRPNSNFRAISPFLRRKVSSVPPQTNTRVPIIDQLKLFLVGIGASTFQGSVGVGHGVIINYGAHAVLKHLPPRKVVGTASFGFLGTGTAMLHILLVQIATTTAKTLFSTRIPSMSQPASEYLERLQPRSVFCWAKEYPIEC